MAALLGCRAMATARRRTGLVYDERCLAHRNPPAGLPFGTYPEWVTTDAFERPERMTLTRQVLEGSGALEHVTELAARPATEDELRLVHTEAHVARVLAACDSPAPVNLGHEAWTVPGSREAALLAAGGLLAAVDAVLAGTVDNAFVVLRPPGHHAEPGAGMGFCLFNNTAVAARWAQRERGVERVAIVDWDVHHGNGTEEIFCDRPVGAERLAAPGRPLSRPHRRAGRARRGERQRPAAAEHRRRRLRARLRHRRRARRARIRPRPGDRRRRAGRLGLRPARPDVGHGARLPRADRPGGRAGGRDLRRPPGGDARGRLLAAASPAGQPRHPRGAGRPGADLRRGSRSAATCRSCCATRSAPRWPPPRRCTSGDPRRARPLDRRRRQSRTCSRRWRTTRARTSWSSAAATRGCGRPGTRWRRART